MRLSEIFPSYPIQIISPRGGNIKIASRRVYVDFPYVFWNFMGDVALKASKSKSPQEIFKKELELFNSDEEIRKITTFNNIPLGTISLITHPFTTKLLLKLKVNWRLFFQYLENKARELASKVEVDGSNIREVYNEITGNYFKLVPFIPNPKMARFNVYALENFKKLLRKQQEEQNIQLSLSILKQIIKNVREATKLKGIKLWTLQLESDVYGIEKCLENVDILSCYFYLRNALENLIKLVVYNDIAKNFNIYDGMLRIFFFYEKVAKDRCYSIQRLKSKYVKRIARYLRSTAEINLEKIYLMMIKKRIPKMSINKQTLEEFQKVYNINIPIKNYWSACSEIIHNRSPLPFFSLLEVKSFKHFLRRYVERFASVIKIILSIANLPVGRGVKFYVTEYGTVPLITKELAKEKTSQIFPESKQKLSENSKRALRQLIFQKEKEIRVILKSIMEDKTLRKEIFFDPLTLVSLFYLASPGLTRISSEGFSIDDIEYLIMKIQPISFHVKGSLKHEFYTTLQMFEEKLIPKLEQVSSEFSKLNEEEKKTVIFYLLAMESPKLFSLN